MGLLRIKGVIALDQFWPGGESDADTSKIIVRVERGAFSFAADEKRFRTTHVFDRAKVRGVKKDYVIKNSRIKVRLQGIDAPELHFKAPPLKKTPDVSAEERERYNGANRQFRQFMGESATVALAKKLAAQGGAEVRCEVYSFLDAPGEVIDTYGRFIGNIRVGRGFRQDVNLWLAAEGWAFPTFYSSMRESEIRELTDAAARGRRKGRVWACYSDDTGTFRPGLQYRKPAAKPLVSAQADVGPLLLPKLFRRQVAWWLGKKAGVWGGNLRDYLERNPERYYRTDEFLEQGIHSASERQLHDALRGRRFTLQPEELVLKEKFSALEDERGRKIERF